jgi:hypothetical protein
MGMLARISDRPAPLASDSVTKRTPESNDRSIIGYLLDGHQ